MLTLVGRDSQLPSSTILMRYMKNVEDLLAAGLRRGDVITRWNEAEFRFILHSLNLEQAKMALGRIEEAFCRSYPEAELTMRIDVKAIDAVQPNVRG